MQILLVAETFGFWLALTSAMLAVSALVRSLVQLVWTESLEGRVVDATDALDAMILIVIQGISWAKSNGLATVCTVASFTLLSGWIGVSVFASFGLSTVVLAVVGFATPAFMKKAKVTSTDATALDP